MGKKGDQHIRGNAVLKKMICQRTVKQNCDARCTYHPLGKTCNSIQHAEVFLDEDKRSKIVNLKETI